jgi:hypothetical protein
MALPYVREHVTCDVAATVVFAVTAAFPIAATGVAAGGHSVFWALSNVEGKISSHSCGAAQHSTAQHSTV